MSTITCYHCGETVSYEGNVCVLCGAEKEISIELSGAKMMRGIITFAVTCGVGYFSQHIGYALVFGGLALYASSNHFQDSLNKKYPGKNIRMW